MYERYIWTKNNIKKNEYFVVKKAIFKKSKNNYISEELQMLFHSSDEFFYENMTLLNASSAFVLSDSKYEKSFDNYDDYDIDHKLNIKHIASFIIKK